MPPRRDPSEDGVLNPLSPGLAVLDARLPLLALALRALGILLLGARLAGVLTAHLATLHLFHGGHHVRVLGGLVRFEYLPHLFRKAMSDLPKTGTRGRGGMTGEKARRWSRRGGQQRFALAVMLTFIQQHSIFISISLSPFMHYGHTRHNRLVAPPLSGDTGLSAALSRRHDSRSRRLDSLVWPQRGRAESPPDTVLK